MTKQKISVLFSKSPVLLLLLMAIAIGYGQTPTATLSGVVRNEQGDVIKEATVTVKNSATGNARQVTSDSEGRYVFLLLEPGSYELEVQAAGFKLLMQKNLILKVGGTTARDVQIEVGGISEQVNIDVKNLYMESNKVDMSSVVAEDEIQGLQNNGRNFVEFTKLSSMITKGR